MKIKHIKALMVTVISLTIILPSCKKNLQEDPYSSLSADAVFTNEDGLKKATLGIYQGFTSDAFTAWYRFGLSETGHQYAAQGIFGEAFWGDQNKFIGTSSSQVAGECNSIWSQDYNIIARANTVIDNASKAVTDAALASQYIAEARFLRGFTYFDLVRHFGGVPLVDKQITSLGQSDLLFGQRATIQQTYDFIVADLLAAIPNLPDKREGSDVGRVSAGAAKAMLGKVYLNMAGKPLNLTANYQKAIEILNQVVGPANESKYNFSLLPNFKDVFSFSNERNPEILLSFSWNYTTTSGGAITPFFSLPRNFVSPDEQTFYGLTYQFYQLFENKDTRRDQTVVTRYKSVSSGDGALVGDSIIYNAGRMKYIDTVTHTVFGNATVNQGISYAKFDRSPRATGNPFSFSQDVVMLRFSDVLLCLAEAMIENGDPASALPLINRVRARAGATPYVGLTAMRDREGWSAAWN
ncbi:MAG: RagB/SusD family nutrient uptake outer membrane protein [Mucilaginibacter sp.]|nr:RagB/SusD family nutrient uptake outer membrane protein [Mucilaginibacter sp.]